MTNQIFKQFFGVIGEANEQGQFPVGSFKYWLKKQVSDTDTRTNAQMLDEIGALVFIHEKPKYYDAEGNPIFDESSVYDGAIYANGMFYKMSDVEGFELTAQKIADLVSGKSGCSVTVVTDEDGVERLVFTPVLVEKLTVTGVEVGNLSDGDEFVAGYSIEQLLRDMLMKEIGTEAVLPTVDLLNATPKEVYIGETYSYDLGFDYTDGKFVGLEGYDYEVNAGCAKSTTQYFAGGTEITSSLPYSYTPTSESSLTLSVKQGYSANSVTPKTNMGKDDSATIAAGIVNDSETIKSYYKVYYWKNTTTDLTSSTGAEIKEQLDKFTPAMLKSNVSVIGSTATAIGSAANTGYVYVVTPASKPKPYFQNEFGTQAEMTYLASLSENGVDYSVYYFKANGSKYKNCVIVK